MTDTVEPRRTVAQVAALTHSGEDYIRAEISAGRLKSYLPHGKKRGRLVRLDWLREWEEGQAPSRVRQDVV